MYFKISELDPKISSWIWKVFFFFISERLYLYTVYIRPLDIKDKIRFKNGLSFELVQEETEAQEGYMCILHVQNFISSCFPSFMDSGIQPIVSLYSIRTNSKPEEFVSIVIKWTLSHSNRGSFQLFSQQ